MKLPRDLSGADLTKALGHLGYRVTRQTGSHVRLSTEAPTTHHITIPAHDPLKVGTTCAERRLTLREPSATFGSRSCS